MSVHYLAGFVGDVDCIVYVCMLFRCLCTCVSNLT